MIHFEDFQTGETREFGAHVVTAEEIVAFASRFDAQDFHVDAQAAKMSFAGGLIASGWHSAALCMRLMSEGFILRSASRGGPGIDELRWLRPVLPGDWLTLRRHVLETKPSRSRPEMGLVRFRFELLNQRDEIVFDQLNWIMFGRRGHGHGLEESRVETPAIYVPPRRLSPILPPRTPPQPAKFFEEVAIGERLEIGSFEFTAEEIVAFARPFDPQLFHIDAEAATRSAFGALCASGWHTASVWMMLMVAEWRRAEALRAGRPGPRKGVSPGFGNLRWLRPVYAGDVIRYSSTVAHKRASGSRPGWGLVFHRNLGVNQRGEEVFSFDGCAFLERKPG